MPREEVANMTRHWSALAAAACILFGLGAPDPALAQKPGGILKIYHRDSPASMSIHEEGTIGVILPMMGVFNNLVVFDQHVPQNSSNSIVPELATGWTWNADHTAGLDNSPSTAQGMYLVSIGFSR